MTGTSRVSIENAPTQALPSPATIVTTLESINRPVLSPQPSVSHRPSPGGRFLTTNTNVKNTSLSFPGHQDSSPPASHHSVHADNGGTEVTSASGLLTNPIVSVGNIVGWVGDKAVRSPGVSRQSSTITETVMLATSPAYVINNTIQDHNNSLRLPRRLVFNLNTAFSGFFPFYRP